MLAPSEGSLMIAGHDPIKEPPLVRRAFGIVFHDPSLDDELTAAVPGARTAAAIAALRAA